MYNDCWWIDSRIYLLEVQNCEIQYSTAFREIDGSVIDVPEESGWILPVLVGLIFLEMILFFMAVGLTKQHYQSENVHFYQRTSI